MDLRIAVISDLHCHSKEANNDVQESYLLTDRVAPEHLDPFESFITLIKQQEEKGDPLIADILVMSGDFTNKTDYSGFDFGWEITQKIASLLKVKMIVPTIGNHDVDSRGKFSTNPFFKPQNLSETFPFIETSLNNSFWEKGFVFLESDIYRILVINSAHLHTNPQEADHGFISQKTINSIREYLESVKETKLHNIAICHHHPIAHERNYLGHHDVITNGSVLVELLDEFNYKIIIHGHKHDPFIRYALGGSNSPVVFSAGSFSAYKSLLLQGAYNTFHMVTLEGNTKKYCKNHGLINTWFFTPSKGWDTDVINAYFYSEIGFGCRTSLDDIVSEIKDWIISLPSKSTDWQTFNSKFEMIKYLLPLDKVKLGKALKGEQISLYPTFPSTPEIISCTI